VVFPRLKDFDVLSKLEPEQLESIDNGSGRSF